MEFGEWLRARAPGSYRDYMRYFEKHRGVLERLELRRLPCNSWLLKLAGLWLDYLLQSGELAVDVYAVKRLELQAVRRVCGGISRGRGSGLGRCPVAPRLPERGLKWFSVALLALESGVRVKHLWRASLEAGEPRLSGGVVVLDVRIDYGFKRVNVIVARESTWEEARRVLSQVSYDYVKKLFTVRGWTPPGCYRKYHWNLCLEASGDRLLCGFVQGRWRPVEIGYYEDYVSRSVGVLRSILPGVDALASGASLAEALRLLKDNSPPHGVENGPKPGAGAPAEGLREPLGDGDAETVGALASLVRKYSDLLG